jgi:DNA repair exonuclease SbcCD ATPase subunit|tara:strand:- start:394 stop:2112 length:1719 start_codon:yes stop_codon:yes gene_type:complete
MILFEKIRWKNLLSTGNQFVEVELSKNSTTLIMGPNGAGKSTILDALCFVLYGKSFRKIRKDQLINTTNEKGTVVEIEFNVNTTGWKIVRGIKPNIFEIYKNGTLLDQSSHSLDQQKWLDQNVLKMNYKSFTQIVILGSSSFIPFMQLTTSHRKEVVEDLLDIKIFSSMNAIVKEKVRSCNDKIRSLEYKKDSILDKVVMQKEFIDEIECRSNQTIEEKRERIDRLIQESDHYVMENHVTEDEVTDLRKKMEIVSGATSKVKKLMPLKGKMSSKVSIITKEHKFFTENRVCPTCTQSIEEEFRLNKISDSKNRAKELQQGYEELKEAIQKEELRESQFQVFSKEVTKLLNGITQNNTHISGCQKQIQQLESEIQRTSTQLTNRNSEYEKLSDFNNSLEDTYQHLAKKREDISYYSFTYNLLKDSGVKSKIIKKYLPLINQQVNKYLQMMDFYINFQLSEEFNETIQNPIQEDFTYSSFSEGEKSRIDLALILTWRDVARFKNSVNTNLLLFDETLDSSLDGPGSDEFIKIIKYAVKDCNIFVISHKQGMEEKFHNVMEFSKVKGFSHMSMNN